MEWALRNQPLMERRALAVNAGTRNPSLKEMTHFPGSRLHFICEDGPGVSESYSGRQPATNMGSVAPANGQFKS